MSKKELLAIAAQMRGLGPFVSGTNTRTDRYVGGVLLLRAMQLGAFSEPAFILLRHEVESALETSGDDPCWAFTVAVDWLADLKRRPRPGGPSIPAAFWRDDRHPSHRAMLNPPAAWMIANFLAMAEMIEIEAEKAGGYEDNDFETEHEDGPDLPAGDDSSCLHADDFRSVAWHGAEYTFTPTQAACIKVWWEHWDRGTPEVGDDTVMETAELATTSRLDSVFRGREKSLHPAWGSMIVPGNTKGTHRLADS